MISTSGDGLSLNQKIQKFTLLNESGDKWLSRRKIIGGTNTNLMELIPHKYSWAMDLFRKHSENFWSIDKMDLSKEKEDYDSLSEIEKKAFEKILCSVNSVESLTYLNYQIVNQYITAPEVSLGFSVLQFQNAKHTYAYSRIIESSVGLTDSENVYNVWRTSEELRKRNSLFNAKLLEFCNNPTTDNYLRNLVVCAISGTVFALTEFSLIYAMARRSKLTSSAGLIKYVHRDMREHSTFLMHVYNTTLEENPKLSTGEFKRSIANLVREMVNIETDFVQSVSAGMIPGLSDLSIAKFSQAQANRILKSANQEIMYPGISGNPLPWFDSFAEIKEI